MQTVAFRVPDRDLTAFMKLVETMPTVQRIEMPTTEEKDAEEDRPQTKEEFLTDFREAYLEAKEIAAGRKNGQSFDELLKELEGEGLL